MTAYVPIFLHMKTPAVSGRCSPLEPEYLIKLKGEKRTKKKEGEARRDMKENETLQYDSLVHRFDACHLSHCL
jgi:hypothetical protein